MKVLRALLITLAVPVLVFAIFLLYSTLDDYRPRAVAAIELTGEVDVISDTAALDLVIWNIGYAGLDASMDFFYDGGAQMRPSKEQVSRNLEGIQENLDMFREHDFILLQEVDKGSRRSYRTSQYQLIDAQFNKHTALFGTNYRVDFVPIPVKEPMGKVESGLMTLSRYLPASAERHSFPGNYAWPVKLFMLDRCFLVSRYPVGTDKYLLVINTHNSAYDDGSLRQEQMDHLAEFLLQEYAKGNYIVVGGDWNQTPHGVETSLPGHRFDTVDLSYIEKDYPAAGWHWAFDPGIPTNRRVATPYEKGISPTTIIDCFLCSPNIRVEEVRTIDLDFRDSDHQPVSLRLRFGP